MEFPKIEKLGFGYLAGSDRLSGNPNTLNRAVLVSNADSLQVRLERTLSCAGHVETDSAFFLRQTLTDNAASTNGFLACNCTFLTHLKYLGSVSFKIVLLSKSLGI